MAIFYRLDDIKPLETIYIIPDRILFTIFNALKTKKEKRLKNQDTYAKYTPEYI